MLPSPPSPRPHPTPPARRGCGSRAGAWARATSWSARDSGLRCCGGPARDGTPVPHGALPRWGLLQPRACAHKAIPAPRPQRSLAPRGRQKSGDQDRPGVRGPRSEGVALVGVSQGGGSGGQDGERMWQPGRLGVQTEANPQQGLPRSSGLAEVLGPDLRGVWPPPRLCPLPGALWDVAPTLLVAPAAHAHPGRFKGAEVVCAHVGPGQREGPGARVSPDAEPVQKPGP